MSDQEINTSKDDFVSQALSYLTSKKGMYMIVGIILIGCICYYKFNQDKKDKESKPETQNSEPVENKENIHQPPPGYVTVPIEMVQQMQQQLNYQEHLLSQQQPQPPQPPRRGGGGRRGGGKKLITRGASRDKCHAGSCTMRSH